MKVLKIKDRFYQEIALENLQSKLDNLIAQKNSINYNALKKEYDQNITSMQEYEKNLDIEISELEKLIKE